MADSRLDAKLDHLLTEYFLSIGNNHEIRQMFKENNLYQFEEFIACDIQSLTEIKRKKHNTMVPFNHRKLTLIHDIVLYYKFLLSDTATRTLAEDPENWVREDYKLWKNQGCHPTTASANAVSSGTSANATASPAAVCPDTKKAENAWMSW